MVDQITEQRLLQLIKPLYSQYLQPIFISHGVKSYEGAKEQAQKKWIGCAHAWESRRSKQQDWYGDQQVPKD